MLQVTLWSFSDITHHFIILLWCWQRGWGEKHIEQWSFCFTVIKSFYIYWMLFSVCWVLVLPWLADTGQITGEQRLNLVIWVCFSFLRAPERQRHHRKQTLESNGHCWRVWLTLSVCSGLRCNFWPQLCLFFSVTKQLQQLVCGSYSSFDKNLGNTCRQA